MQVVTTNDGVAPDIASMERGGGEGYSRGNARSIKIVNSE